MVQSECTVVKHGQIWSYLLWHETTTACVEAARVCHHCWQHYNYDRRTENFGRGVRQFSDIWPTCTEHIRNCNFHLRAYRHIRLSLTQDVANMMATSIIGSRIDYCNSLLIGISEQNLDKLQRIQSKAARIVCNAGRQVTSSDVLYSLHWLPVRRRIEFKTATLCFKAVRLGNPP